MSATLPCNESPCYSNYWLSDVSVRLNEGWAEKFHNMPKAEFQICQQKMGPSVDIALQRIHDFHLKADLTTEELRAGTYSILKDLYASSETICADQAKYLKTEKTWSEKSKEIVQDISDIFGKIFKEKRLEKPEVITGLATKGLDLAEKKVQERDLSRSVDVLKRVWNCSRPTLFFENYAPVKDSADSYQMQEEEAWANKSEAEDAIRRAGDSRIEYFGGRCIETNVSDPWNIDLEKFQKKCRPDRTLHEVKVCFHMAFPG